MGFKKLSPKEKAEYKDKKRSEMEAMFQKINDGVKAVFESDRYKEYLRFMSKFTDYSARNCMLILMQNPEASLVAAYGKWKQLGRQVCKGETGIAILAPVTYKSKQKVKHEVRDSNGNSVYNEDGTVKTETEEKEYTELGFKKAYVFDVSQTEGKELPQMVNDLSEEIQPEQVDAVINGLRNATGIPIDFEDIKGSARGYYSPSQDRIVIRNAMSGAQTVKTAIHEAAHKLLHDPKQEIATAQSSRDEMEVQAESIAFIVSEHFGLDTSDYSFPYIASWSSGKPLEKLNKVLAEIQTAAKTLTSAIEAEITLNNGQNEEFENADEPEFSGIAIY